MLPLSVDPRTTHALEAAGWFAGRQVDIDSYLKALGEGGYAVTEPVIQFLREFGGLRLSFPHYRVPGQIDNCHFDPALAVSRIWSNRVQEWAGLVDEGLCVIGEAFRDNMTLVMGGSSGSVFAGRDELVLSVGDTGAVAIEALCLGHQLVPIRDA